MSVAALFCRHRLEIIDKAKTLATQDAFIGWFYKRYDDDLSEGAKADVNLTNAVLMRIYAEHSPFHRK